MDRNKTVRFKGERATDNNEIDIEMMEGSDDEAHDKSIPNRSEEVGDVSVRSANDQRHGMGKGYFDEEKSYNIKTNSSVDKGEKSLKHLQNNMNVK